MPTNQSYMGNSSSRYIGSSWRNQDNVNNTSQRNNQLEQITSTLVSNLSGRSFASLSSHQSTYSASRSWSRISRRRWKESTLTLSNESTKTSWPFSQLEAFFLPDYPLRATFKEQNFKVLEEIAAGAFGKVYKVEKNDTKEVYALKVLAKSKIIKENSVQQVKDEVKFQRVCGHHPFIVSSPYHWQTRRHLYIVSEFIEGGELFNLLKTYGVLPVELVQLYIAQIAFALDFLHNAGIIYRDLKPENILLDAEGHIQLIDFGLSKWLSYGSKTKTLCGTFRYIAPEVASLQPYGHAVDWWSLGVVACLMLTGQYPGSVFPSNSAGKPSSRRPGALPEDCSIDMASKDLLMRLLEPEPTRRMRSFRTLQTIAFYKGYHFDDATQKKISPKVILNVSFPNGPAQEPIDVEDFDTEMDIA